MEVHLFSPQTYHTFYGGHSTVGGNQVDMFADDLKVSVNIERDGSNGPMMNDCTVPDDEMKKHGSHI